MGDKKHPKKPVRTEPSLGNVDHVHDAPSASPPSAPASPQPDDVRVPGEARKRSAAPVRENRRRPWIWIVLAALVIVIGSAAWFNQGYLRSLLPRTQLNSLLARADKALAEGRLEGNEGQSARELYAAVRALQPDNEHAHTGLQKVGKAELERARKAFKAGDYAKAQSELDDARELLGGGKQINTLAQQLVKAQQSQAQTNALITRAQQALAQGKLDGEQGAANLYRQALKADSGNAVARHGLDKVGDKLAAQAQAALDAGKLDQADSLIGHIASVMPGYGDLPALRANLSQARQQSEKAVNNHLDKARAALRAGHFTGDGDDNALAQFQAALKLDPDNAKARAGVGQIAQGLVLRANASLDAGDIDAAGALLKQATQLAPHLAELAPAQSRLKSARAHADDQLPQTKLSPEQQTRVTSLLKRAQSALEADDIMLPPGASAYDLYSEVLNIDPNNRDALSGLQGLARHARQNFDRALSSGDLAKADKMLKVLAQLVPGGAAQPDMRKRLAGAWLDRAEHSMDSGDRAAARQALDAARKLRPDAPRLQALRSRIGNS